MLVTMAIQNCKPSFLMETEITVKVTDANGKESKEFIPVLESFKHN